MPDLTDTCQALDRPGISEQTATMATKRETITEIAEANGWTLTMACDTFQVWVKQGPMIDRTDLNRLRIRYGFSDATIRAVHYGPDDRPHPLPKSVVAVRRHLESVRSGQRS